jgi:anti-anti-sigma regulatory factor
MPFEKFDRDEFLYVKYSQDTISDKECLKNALLMEAAAGKRRDTILEFTSATILYSVEIGMIVQFLKTLSGSGRFLRLVASNYVCEMLVTMNIHRIPNLILYNSMDAIREHYPMVNFEEFVSIGTEGEEMGEA